MKSEGNREKDGKREWKVEEESGKGRRTEEEGGQRWKRLEERSRE